MSSDPIKPKIGFKFVLENLRKLWTLIQSNEESIQKDINETQRLSAPIAPKPEKRKGSYKISQIIVLADLNEMILRMLRDIILTTTIAFRQVDPAAVIGCGSFMKSEHGFSL